ncbi:MAG: pyridoxamine 5'-phosphate oxidase [Gammaproteobacteria bacterium]|nr:pyridoxamine 5'-phosphate oxidase [Gammaproteobacteria bacterium]
MIIFNNLSKSAPYLVFKEKYDESHDANQKNIEAICIASYSRESNEVNARFVNLKFINDKDFIFFSNYSSIKAKDFCSHSQITALIYWHNIDVQIRMKAIIKKTSKEFNNKYFAERDEQKNALAISSMQSKEISSYDEVKNNFSKSLKSDNLKDCPDYWGGYSFSPYYFEFWQGHRSRLNKRDVYEVKNDKWAHSILQP